MVAIIESSEQRSGRKGEGIQKTLQIPLLAPSFPGVCISGRLLPAARGRRDRLLSLQVRVNGNDTEEEVPNRLELQRPLQEQATAAPPANAADAAEKGVDLARMLLRLTLSILSLGASPALASRMRNQRATRVSNADVSMHRVPSVARSFAARLRSAFKGDERHRENVAKTENR